MSSGPAEKSTPEKKPATLADRLKAGLTVDGEKNVNKPDSRPANLGSPNSPLRGRTGAGLGTAATSSSSSSSGSTTSGRTLPRPNPSVPRKPDSTPRSRAGGISAQSSPSSARNVRPGHRRADSAASNPSIYSSSSSVSSPSSKVRPGGNLFPSGIVVTTGMENQTPTTNVMRTGPYNYGFGSVMWGSGESKPSLGGSGSGNNDAEELKRLGNDNYKKGNFEEALSLYEKAITISPGNAVCHFNRAAVLMVLKRLVEAVKECEEAIRLDPGYVRAHHRLGSLLLSLGNIENARKHICLPGHPPDPVELQKLQSVENHLIKCTNSRKVGDWKSTLREVEAAILSGADASPQLSACRAEALLKLEKLDDAFLALSKPADPCSSHSQSKIFGMHFEAYPFFVRSQVELSTGRFDNAVATIEKARRMDRQSAEITVLLNNVRLVTGARARGNDLFISDRFTEALLAYDQGLKHDPLNAVLYCNRAACRIKLGQWEHSLDDCNRALNLQPNYTKALLRRAASNSKLERWHEAVNDYEILRGVLPNDNEVAESLFHAQVALKKSCGEDVSNMTFGGEVESVSTLEQFGAAISSPCASVVHFKTSSNVECKKMSSFLDTLCARYPSINFLKVDIEESPAIAQAENVRIVPTFKIYRKGKRVKEMVSPNPEFLESSVRHYSFI